MAQWHAIIPLAILEAVRGADQSSSNPVEEFWDEARPVKLGRSATIAAQIDRYGRLADRGERVDAGEVVGLFRLVGRRGDAESVFIDAGCRAGRMAARRTSRALRLIFRGLPRPLRRLLGHRLVRLAAHDVFGVTMQRAERATWPDGALLVGATSSGTACALFGAAINELLRAFAPFDGTLAHTSCCAQGDAACLWSPDKSEQG
jgi:hypothetical protein